MAVKKPAVREDPQQYVLKKNYRRAAELYRAQVQDNPDDTNTYLRLGDCQVLDGDVGGAVDSYKKAAQLYANQGFLLKAIGVNKKIVKLDPTQEAVHRQLSDQAEERGLLAGPGRSPASAPAAAAGFAFDMEASSDDDDELAIADVGAGAALPEPGLELSADDDLLDLVAAAEAPEAAPSEWSVDELGDALAEVPSDDTSERDESVQKTPLFSDFTAAELVEVVKQMSEASYAKGQTIVREGEPGDSLFVIVSGGVRVVTHAGGQELDLALLGEGEFFGEGALITTRPRTATIIANQDSELLSLSRAALDQIVTTHPRVREVMLQFYQRRAESTVRSILKSKR